MLNKPSPRLEILRQQLAQEKEAVERERRSFKLASMYPEVRKTPPMDKFFDLEPTYNEDLAEWIKECEERKKPTTTKVCSGCAGAPRAQDDGWIEHEPGDWMPVWGEVQVYVRLRNGAESPCSREACWWRWSESADSDHDIVAWRRAPEGDFAEGDAS